MKRTTRIICAAVWIYEKNGKNCKNYLLTPTECVLYIVLQYLPPVNNGNLLD